ncbi:MAG TPA: hypothetical protein VM933_03230 [Acidimicrobiales bacterium]|nr:hypothetical protein [Acidimicrobiales bacterium]
MAKVTVYVTDEQLERLKSARGVGAKGGMSKAFQAFLEQVIGGGAAPAGRYDYARKLMPVSAAIDRHRRALGRKVADGGPPADGGPVAAALTVLVYRELLRRDPELEAALEKEFLRFGLDELVAAETADLDLLAEPEGEDDVEIDESDRGPAGPFGINLGEELRGVTEAIRTADAIRENILGGRTRHRGGPVPPTPPMPPRPPRPPRPGSGRRVEIRVGSSDDPREVLTVTEFERFSKRHDDWEPGRDLTPSQIESVTDLLRDRVDRELDLDDDE